MRKLLIHPGRTGFVFVLDRVTGELLSAQKFYPQTNWASGYDLEDRLSDDRPREAHARRAKPPTTSARRPPARRRSFPSAVSPRTGLLYIPAHDFCMQYKGMEANYIAGTPYLGADVLMQPGPTGSRGAIVAWDIANAKPAWRIEEHWPILSGVLTTAGDLVFYGVTDGWFKAADATQRQGALAVQDGLGNHRQTRSPSPRPTASNTLRSTPASAAGSAPTYSHRFPPTTPPPRSARRAPRRI